MTRLAKNRRHSAERLLGILVVVLVVLFASQVTGSFAFVDDDSCSGQSCPERSRECCPAGCVLCACCAFGTLALPDSALPIDGCEVIRPVAFTSQPFTPDPRAHEIPHVP